MMCAPPSPRIWSLGSKHVGKMKIISEADMHPRGQKSQALADAQGRGSPQQQSWASPRASPALPLIEPVSLTEKAGKKLGMAGLQEKGSTTSVIFLDDMQKRERSATTLQATDLTSWLADASFPNRVPPQDVVVECIVRSESPGVWCWRETNIRSLSNNLLQVRRAKESTTHEFELHLDGGEGAADKDTFLLGARKRVKTKTPYYAITQNIEDPTCKRTGFVG
jgi:hypothetical protein